MTRILEVKDKNNKLVYITKERWMHLCREHPEVAPYLFYFEETLKNPTKFIDFDNSKKYFYKYFKNRISKEKYLLVLVKYLNGEGFVITAYFKRNIK
mgnify:FL=1